jgi:beta-lactamase regulating signal transducer with metallopeptidase domain
MWVWVDRAGLVFFDAAFSTAILLCLVVLVMLVCRQPSVRLRVARAALLASLAMIPLVTFAPLPRFDLLGTFLEPAHFQLGPSVRSDTSRSGATVRPNGHETGNNVFASNSDRSSDLDRWFLRGLILTSFACTATSLASLLLGFWGIRWLLRSARAASNKTQDLYHQLIAGIAPKRVRPSLRVSSRVHRPVLVGVFRPTILIPDSYEDARASVEPLTLSLLHEVAHAEQSDAWFGMVANLAQSVWFLLPPVWWIRSRLLIDQEFLADRIASEHYGTSSAYAASLLSLAESQLGLSAGGRLDASQSTWPPVQKSGNASPLFQRMLMLLYCPFRVEPRVSRAGFWAIRLTMIGASIATASVSIRWPDAVAIEQRQRAYLATADHPFRVADFVAEPLVFSPGGRALPYIMPVSLPSHFELSVEILSNITELAKVYIAGHPLASIPLQPLVADLARDSSDHAESWHQIRLERNGQALALWVDGRRVPVELDPNATSEWLTFEPGPQRPAHFRNLIVEW